MQKADRFYRVGQVLKSNGTDGQVVISLCAADAADIGGKEPVFIFFDELPVPYFISSAQRRGTNKILAYLTDTVTLEDAEELAGRDIYMRDEDSEDDGVMDFTGWTLCLFNDSICGGNACDSRVSDEAALTCSGTSCADAGQARTYTITGIEDIPGNPCLIADTPEGEVLIPLHEDLVVGIDENKKTLTMNLPEGLF